MNGLNLSFAEIEIPYSVKLLNLYSLFSDAQVLFYHNQKISVFNKKYKHKMLEIFIDYISWKCVYSEFKASYSFRDIKVNYIEILFIHFITIVSIVLLAITSEGWKHWIVLLIFGRFFWSIVHYVNTKPIWTNEFRWTYPIPAKI